MTNKEAMVFMDNLIICIKEHPILADWLVEIANRKDEPQSDYPCNTCANKGDHNGECSNCVADSEPIRWKTSSHYKPKTKCDTCETYWNCQGQCDEMPQIEDEPQIEETQDGFYDEYYRDHEEFYEF